MYGTLRSRASRRPTVDLPDPEQPTTETRRTKRDRTSGPGPSPANLPGWDNRLMTEDHVPAGASLGPGVTMPMIGFGTWQIRGRAAYESVRAALEAGYRHLDTATMYRNEAEVGRAPRGRRPAPRRRLHPPQAPARHRGAGTGHDRREPARPGH